MRRASRSRPWSARSRTCSRSSPRCVASSPWPWRSTARSCLRPTTRRPPWLARPRSSTRRRARTRTKRRTRNRPSATWTSRLPCRIAGSSLNSSYMGTVRARPAFLVALAVALAAGTVYAVQEWRSLPPGEVEVTVREVMRTSKGRAVLVLQERGGDRRLPVLVTAQEAGSLERRLLPGAPPGLAFRSIAAMGGKVSGALIDSVDPDRGFRGRVTFSRFLGPAELALRATEAIALAPDAGAPT